jgi:aspartyl-tRNA(Asn)/glutamyl-tRNA(Gln) amidotransferase subunit A
MDQPPFFTHEVSSVEVIEVSLERIERLNPQVHAFLTVCPEDARRAAYTAEHEIAHGAYRGGCTAFAAGPPDEAEPIFFA